jgi:hypothetical protein
VSVLIGGCSTTPAGDLARLQTIETSMSAAARAEPSNTPLELAQLIALARKRDPAVKRAELQGLIDAAASLAADNAEREAVRRAAAREVATERVAAARLRLRYALLAAAALGADAPADLEAEARRELDHANRMLQAADRGLRELCGLTPDDPIAPLPLEPSPVDQLSLGDYVALVVANNAGVDAATTNRNLRSEAIAGVKAAMWQGFSANVGLGNIAQLLSASPIALFGFTFQLLDQGAQQRRELRARAEAPMAGLDQQDELDGLARLAAQAWLNTFDARAAFKTASMALLRAQRSGISHGRSSSPIASSPLAITIPSANWPRHKLTEQPAGLKPWLPMPSAPCLRAVVRRRVHCEAAGAPRPRGRPACGIRRGLVPVRARRRGPCAGHGGRAPRRA